MTVRMGRTYRRPPVRAWRAAAAPAGWRRLGGALPGRGPPTYPHVTAARQRESSGGVPRAAEDDGGLRVEPVAEPADRGDDVLQPELLAQASHVDVDGAATRGDLVVGPHRLEQLGARHDAVRRAREVRQ